MMASRQGAEVRSRSLAEARKQSQGHAGTAGPRDTNYLSETDRYTLTDFLKVNAALKQLA
jgi:hypothetical protein